MFQASSRYAGFALNVGEYTIFNTIKHRHPSFCPCADRLSDKAKIILYYPANLYPQSHSESENITFQKGAKLAAILAVSCYNYPVGGHFPAQGYCMDM